MGLGGFIALRDVEAGPIEAEVTGVSIEDTQYQEGAIVLDLDSGQRLVMNADRTITMCGMAGDETDQWPGTRIRLYRGSVKGKDAVRVDFPGGAVAPSDDVEKANAELQQLADSDQDDIPF